MKKRLVIYFKSIFVAARGESKVQRAISYLTWAAVGVAIVGSIMSAFGICSGSCTDAEKYRLFGMRFGSLGIPFFLLIAAASFGRNSQRTTVRNFYDTLIFASAGAEWIFLGIQGRIIKSYCPVCVGIAIAVFVAVLLRLAEFYFRKREISSPARKSFKGVARSFCKGVMVVATMYAGLITALLGISSPVVAGSATITQDIWLGKSDSNIEVLIVSDWFCQYCRTSEPIIEKMLPAIGKVSRYTFIDDPIHEHSYNFIPANMSLLTKSKAQYLEGRKALLELSEHNETPDNGQILAALKKRGITLSFLDQATLKQLAHSEAGFIRATAVTLTPTVVVRDRRTGKYQKLVGSTEITEAKISALIRLGSNYPRQ